VLLAVPVGYAVWLIEHSLVLAVLLGAGMLFVVLNMLRLSSAGGGVAPGKPLSDVQTYRPALGTTVVIGMLALMFAQPAQLPLWRTELEPIVSEQREHLVAAHERTIPLSLRERAGERAAVMRRVIALPSPQFSPGGRGSRARVSSMPCSLSASASSTSGHTNARWRSSWSRGATCCWSCPPAQANRSATSCRASRAAAPRLWSAR
jgi:hypothetical protein